MAEVGHFRHRQGQLAAHIIVVEVEDMEVLEVRECGREGAVEDIVGKIEESEGGEGRELARNGPGELVGSNGEVSEEARVGEV
jgi:hypothetical protein